MAPVPWILLRVASRSAHSLAQRRADSACSRRFWLQKADGNDKDKPECRTFDTMKRRISWTVKLPDGATREVRATFSRGGVKWQFKASDEERWDYDSAATAADWDTLEDILCRRAKRGRGVERVESVRRLRLKHRC